MKQIWSWLIGSLERKKLGLYTLLLLVSQALFSVAVLYGLQYAVRFLVEIDIILADNQRVIFEHITETCTPRVL